MAKSKAASSAALLAKLSTPPPSANGAIVQQVDEKEEKLSEKQRLIFKSIELSGHRPRQEIAVLRYNSASTFGAKQAYWVRGFEVFDPSQPVPTHKGHVPFEVKHPPKTGYLYVWRPCSNTNSPAFQGSYHRPFQVRVQDISAIVPGKVYFTFEEVWGRGGRSAIAFDAVISDNQDEEQDNLTLGVGSDEIPAD